MNRCPPRLPASARRGACGFTLVELMVAMLLGLVVIAGALSIFLSGLRSYHSDEALSEVQSNARTAFRLMARDIRQAGLTGCNSQPPTQSPIYPPRVANVLVDGPFNGGTAWWANWANAVHGYADNDPALPAGHAGDSLQLLGATGAGYTVKKHDPSNDEFTLNASSSGIQAGDVVIVCDFNQATLFQAASAGGGTLKYGKGNCSTGLKYPTECGAGAGNRYIFAADGHYASIAKIAAHDWYVDDNAEGGKSLYRTGRGGEAKEMVRGVTGMELTYHTQEADDFVSADSVADWRRVDAVHIKLTLTSTRQRAGTDAKPLERTLQATTTIRNRVPPPQSATG